MRGGEALGRIAAGDDTGFSESKFRAARCNEPQQRHQGLRIEGQRQKGGTMVQVDGGGANAAQCDQLQ